ncbi:peptidylprolyl isomerase [Bifidobacterium italicum]|uniref:Peptidyl-prolyl cis-trans isomerase n=2 Tax=Bifidobacterium italicum TaxID=1960968 RepID=A0A2A2ENA9_9BIFI|nr:peptidylprolyl isomerase [Bifidobacterium italicum]
MAACGSGSPKGDASASSSGSAGASASPTSLTEIKGITATGKPGEKPTVKFKAPLDVPNNGYAFLQEGDGATMKDGDRLCAQGISIDAKTGKEITDTWSTNRPDCSIILTSDSTKMDAELFQLLQGKKINTTLALSSTSGDTSGGAYLTVFTFVSQLKALTKAEGEKVKDVPADLPKVTTAADGKPSIDMNGYKGSDKLIAQPLIKGNGEKITANDTAVVKYSGWLLDGKQFDSSWDRGGTFDASMSGGVIQGWIDGLVGQTVGSQVLLVVPPDLGYGNQAQGEIPANSTLVFVVDILAKY